MKNKLIKLVAWLSHSLFAIIIFGLTSHMPPRIITAGSAITKIVYTALWTGSEIIAVDSTVRP